ncbi:MAG: hypothetical protein GY874_23625 [Desulfobacteraceae bacterium]|nr:hypothetical protein [Desulfobacteraceae bacterium]
MKKLALIITFVATIVMGMSTSALADMFYDMGKSWAEDQAYEFCFAPPPNGVTLAPAPADLEEEAIIALRSGCKDFFIYYIENMCPKKIAGYSKFEKHVFKELTCEIN